MTPKITIRNKTHWPTRMLRPFLTRIAREGFPGTTPANTRTRLVVTIVYRHAAGDNSCTGYAYLNSNHSTIRVPHPKHKMPFPVRDFCHTVAHEFGHNRGLRHGSIGLKFTNGHYDWAKALPVPVVLPKRKPTTAEKRAAKLKAAQAAVSTWTRKRKLAETKLKLWTRKVRALERIIAAASASVAIDAACLGCGDNVTAGVGQYCDVCRADRDPGLSGMG